MMAPTHPTTTSASVHSGSDLYSGDSTQSPQASQHHQKRARQQLSCTHCRTGKLKCNREHPCDQCIKRSRDDACVYLPAPPKKARGSKARNSIGNGGVGMKNSSKGARLGRNTRDRIAELEGLVRELIRNQNQLQNGSKITTGGDTGIKKGSEGDFEFNSSNGTSMSPSETGNSSNGGHSMSSSRSPQEKLEEDHPDVSVGMGGMRTSNGQTSYSGAMHWESILDSIEELKIAVDDEEEEDEEEERFSPEDSTISASVFITGYTGYATKEKLLQAIPSRFVCEKFLKFWFMSDNPMLPIIHKPTFLIEFEQMMVNPSNVTTTWLALFFSMLTLGATSALSSSELDVPLLREEDPDLYRKLASDALYLADITKPKKYTIEALAMYTISLQDATSQLRLWLSLGVFLRLALRLGYHRDPSHYPFLTPFESEMRRRVWTLMWSFDVLTSFSIGLPDMIRQIQSDVKLPSNLHDEDFDPNTKELPSPRPMHEITKMTYIISKSTVSKVFARATDLSHRVEPPDYSEVRALDEELEMAHDFIPAPLRLTTVSQSIFAPSPSVGCRFKLELLYLRTKCVLHRRYLVDAKTPEEEDSRRECVLAATQMLQYLDEICRAKLSGEMEATHMFNNISSPDFLMSAMILCLKLDIVSKVPNPRPDTVKHTERMRSILEMTYKWYKNPPSKFRPPEKAVKALEIMLGKHRNTSNTNVDLTQSFPMPTNPMLDYSTVPMNLDTGNAFNGTGNALPGLYTSGDGMFNFDEASMDWMLLDKMFQEQVQPGLIQSMAFSSPIDPNNMYTTDWNLRP